MMKKMGLLLIAIGCGVVAYTADFGFKIGVSHFDEKHSSPIIGLETKTLTGYDLGLLAKVKIIKPVSIQLGPGVTSKGAEQHYIMSSTSNETYRLTYATFPALLCIDIIKELDILIGPEIGYLLSAKSGLGMDKTDITTIYDKNIDAGIDIGLSYTLLNKLFVGIKYNYGLLATSKITISNDRGVPAGTRETANRGLVLNVGWFFW